MKTKLHPDAQEKNADRVEYWNRWAKRYSDPFESVHRAKNPDQIPVIVEDIRRKLALNSEDEMLDLGCGSAQLAQALLPHVKSVEAVDASHEMLHIAKQHTQGIRLHQAKCTAVPFPDHHFDKVLCYGVLPYCGESPEKVFREIRRVARPGGRVLVGDLPDRRYKHLFFYEIAKRGFSLLLQPWKLPEKFRMADDMKIDIAWFDMGQLSALAEKMGWNTQILKQPENQQYGWKSYTHRFDLILY